MARMTILKAVLHSESEADLVERFERFLRALRQRKEQDILAEEIGDELAEEYWHRPPKMSDHRPPLIGSSDQRRIRQRAARLLARRKEASGLGHLGSTELARLQTLAAGVRLVTIASEARADEIAAGLHAEMPWLAPATEAAWQALRRAARADGAVRLGPLLLDGPPGIGKSAWARRLATALSLPACEVDAGASGAGFAIAGVERGWGSAQPGRLIETILQHRLGNPLVIVDEICKAGTAVSTSGSRHSLQDALLGLLEPGTAASWTCPYFRAAFDLSAVNWVLTANSATDRLPAPFLSRCQLVKLGPIPLADLRSFAERQGRASGLSEPSLLAIAEALARHPVPASLTLRDVLRMIRLAESLERRSVLH